MRKVFERRLTTTPAATAILGAALLALSPFAVTATAAAQSSEQRPLIDVRHYHIDARLDLQGQSLRAQAVVDFVPREATGEVVFELHNGLNVTRVTAGDGSVLQPLRYRQDFTVRVSVPNLVVEQPARLIFEYEGRLAGYEESPIEGVDVAMIHPDHGYLLYPARWFPVNGYAADQFSSVIRVTVPPGYGVIGSGVGSRSETEHGLQYQYEFAQQSFPGSIAVVRDGVGLQVERDGIVNTVVLPSLNDDLALEYGEAAADMVNYFSEQFGTPYSRSLSLVEIGEFSPDGYAAPGIVFLSPYGMKNTFNRRLLGTQVAHQWWRCLVTPGNQNHIWLDKGLGWYSALMEIERAEGPEAFETQIQQTRVEALTYTDIPIIESGRLPDFSPELNALAGAKGAMTMHMLRWVVGEENFPRLLNEFAAQFKWKSAVTADLQDLAENISGRDLDSFFLQWIETSTTPEFSQEYTIYRLGGGKGFSILGKIEQDMDIFQMPIELKIETEGEPEVKVVEVTGKASDYSIESFGKPKRVILDPNNRILRFDDDIRVKVAIRKGEQLVELGYYAEALQEYQRALDVNRYSSLAHYRIAEVFFLQNNYQSAANEFREALNGDQVPEWTQVWSHINLGKIFDVTGQRERAVNEYQLAIRTRDNTQNAQDEARKHLEEPYRRPRREERIY